MKLSTSAVPVLSLSMSVLLAACGGGGASPAPAASIGSAQGAYIGTVSDGREHDTVVLENDQFYSMYGHTVGGAFEVSGFLQGNGKSNNGSFTSPDVLDSTASGQRLSATLSATYVPGSSLNGTLTESAGAVSFTSKPIDTAVFNYNAAANLADIAGAWNTTSLHGYATTLNISATGALTGNSVGCIFSGNVTPRASGKNVFDVAITFGAAPCILAGASVKGIALDYLLTNGKRQLIVATLDQARTNSASFFGVR